MSGDVLVGKIYIIVNSAKMYDAAVDNHGECSIVLQGALLEFCGVSIYDNLTYFKASRLAPSKKAMLAYVITCHISKPVV